MKCYLAIDIGASSGRHIVGWREGGQIQTKEVYRFPNGVKLADGHLTWDVETLLHHVKEGIAAAKRSFQKIESLSIDTWALTMCFSAETRRFSLAMHIGTAALRSSLTGYMSLYLSRSCTAAYQPVEK